MSGNHYDVIIIGSGAGGGTLAWKLAPSGKRILLIERGDYVPRERENWSTKAVNQEGRYNTKEEWRDRKGKVETVEPRGFPVDPVAEAAASPADPNKVSQTAP